MPASSKPKSKKADGKSRVEMMNSMLDERGFLCFFAVCQPGFDTASDIIAILHNELEARGMTCEEITALVEKGGR